jgi:hypothetical protein
MEEDQALPCLGYAVTSNAMAPRQLGQWVVKAGSKIF